MAALMAQSRQRERAKLAFMAEVAAEAQDLFIAPIDDLEGRNVVALFRDGSAIAWRADARAGYTGLDIVDADTVTYVRFRAAKQERLYTCANCGRRAYGDPTDSSDICRPCFASLNS